MKTPCSTTALFLLFAGASCAFAGTAQLVKDINLVPNGVGGAPAGFAELGGQIYFVASNYRDGMELWRSDGTTEGTAVVKPFPYQGLEWQYTMAPARLGDALYFIASDGVTGHELWRTDGTAAGTVLVKDIRPGADPGMGYRTAIVACNGKLLFAANDGVSGTELWVSDGTAAGTVMLKDLVAGAGSGVDTGISLVSAGNFVFFQSAYDWQGRELWRSDGTAAGTVKLYTGFSQTEPLTVTGGICYFWTSSNGTMRSDGTVAGTVPLGAPASSIGNFTHIGSTTFFSAYTSGHGTELWSTNGTPGGTVEVSDLNPAGSQGSDPGQFITVGQDLYFAADNGTSGRELFVRESSGVIRLVKDIAAANLHLSSDPVPLGVLNGQLIFQADDKVNGPALWKTDGTTAGTVKCADPVPGAGRLVEWIWPRAFAFGGRLYFKGNDGIHGEELWVTDGTAGGTRMLKDLEDGNTESNPQSLTAAPDGTVYFVASDGINGREVWKSDGTAAGTVMVGQAHAGNAGFSGGVSIVPFGAGIAFASTNGDTSVAANRTLWYSATGSASLVALWQHPAGLVQNLTVLGSSLYFTTVTSGQTGNTLWKTTTAGGATPVKNFTQNSPTHERYFPPPVIMGGSLYFHAAEDASIWLWKTDGTAAGTEQIKYLSSAPVRNVSTPLPGPPVVCNDRIYFVVPDAAVGTEPWVSDGTAAGTGLLKDLAPGPPGSSTSEFTAALGTVFFKSWGTGKQAIWKTDGSPAGTQPVYEFGSGIEHLFSFAEARGRIFFMTSGTTELALWTCDGTAAGTVKVWVAPVRSGGSVTAAGSRVWFRGSDGIRDRIWVSDGTAAGTVIEDPPDSPTAHQFTLAGSRLFFDGHTSAHGTELWSIPATSPPTGSLVLRSISATGATFEAMVEPGLQSVSASLQHGPTLAYGQSVSLTTSNTGLPETLTVSLTGLQEAGPGHARLVITNADGTFTGPDVPFQTLTPAYITWMQSHFGTAEASGNSLPDADADGDAQTNYFEFIAGTDPGSGASAFSLRFNAVPAGVEFGPAVPGVRYFVETSDSLGVWTALPAATFSAPQATATAPLSGAGVRQFTRIRLEPVP